MGISVNGRRRPPGTEAGGGQGPWPGQWDNPAQGSKWCDLGKINLFVHSSLIEREQQLDMLLSENSKALKIMPDTK